MKGSKLYFATDASLGGDLSLTEAIEPLVGMGIEVYVLLTGDCEGMTAPKDDSGVETQSFRAFTVGDLGDDCGCHSQGDGDKGAARPTALGFTPLSTKPGADEPPRGPINDPASPAPDDHGNTVANATRPPRRRARPGRHHRRRARHRHVPRRPRRGQEKPHLRPLETGNRQTTRLLGPDGTTPLFSTSDPSANIDYTPTVSGDYFVSIDNGGLYPGPTYYSVRLAGDGLFDATRSAVVFFSQLAAETGGMFTLPTNFGSSGPPQRGSARTSPAPCSATPSSGPTPRSFCPSARTPASSSGARARTGPRAHDPRVPRRRYPGQGGATILGPDRLLAVLNPAAGDRQSMPMFASSRCWARTQRSPSARRCSPSANRIDADPRLSTTVTPDVLRPGQTQRLQVWGNHASSPTISPSASAPASPSSRRPRLREPARTGGRLAPDADTGYRRLLIKGMPSPLGLELDRADLRIARSRSPWLTAITPNLILARTDVREVELVASLTLDPATASADFGPGITVESFTVVDPTARAPRPDRGRRALGRRRVDITSRTHRHPHQRLHGRSGQRPADRRMITSISGDQGQTLPVTIRVRGLAPLAGTASFGDGVTVEQLDVLDATTAVAPGTHRRPRRAERGDHLRRRHSPGPRRFRVDAVPAPFGVPSVSVSPPGPRPAHDLR
ncbi:MAG: hypothetical protein U0835_24695 [Isosphaeraceae bacterium]